MNVVPKQSYVNRSIKRAGDIIFSLFMLTFGMPLFIFICVLIKFTSPGPVFYVQQRIGRDYKKFGCIKFRTMRKDAENILHSVLNQSSSLRQEFERDFKLRKDPRITPIGKLLRRSSLDELPQFINILLGEMSVVGPRPIVQKELSRYGENMDRISSVRPGLTGLWQVSGRNNLTYSKRIELDLKYTEECSFILDVKILLKTFGVLLWPIDRGAY